MNKIKDLFYDINDILIAVIIIIAAVLIIFTRFDTIITYPERISSGQASQGGYIHAERPGAPASEDEPESEVPAAEDEPDSDSPADAEPADDPAGEDIVHSAFSLYIAYGEPMSSVARHLVQLGFFESAQDFLDTLERNNAGTKVQAGNFVIPADSTKDDVIRIITRSL